MKTDLLSAKRVSATTDAWSGKNSVDNYLGVTVTYFSRKTMERKCLNIGKFSCCKVIVFEIFYLACRRFNQRHTGLQLASSLTQIFEEFGISEKIWKVTTDGARNMIKSKFILC